MILSKKRVKFKAPHIRSGQVDQRIWASLSLPFPDRGPDWRNYFGRVTFFHYSPSPVNESVCLLHPFLALTWLSISEMPTLSISSSLISGTVV